MPTVSLLVLAKNEARNIADCLASARGVDEVIVVDDDSEDETRSLAEAGGARVLRRRLDSFADQLNFARDQAAGDWVFVLDADERFSPELMLSIRKHLAEKPGQVGTVVRRNQAFGRRFRFGPLRPDRTPRLFPKTGIRWSGLVHQFPHYSLPAAALAGHLVHYTYRDWDHYLKKMERYATLWAEDAHRRGKTAGSVEIWLRLAWNWFKMFVVNLGLLGGPTTWAVCYFNGAYTLSKYLKLAERNRVKAAPLNENRR